MRTMVFCGLFCVCSVVWAVEPLKLCFEFWPPYAEVKNGQAVGLSIHLYQQAFERMKVPYEFVEKPWVRCQWDVQHGKAAAILFDVPGESGTAGVVHNGVSLESWVLGVWVPEDSPHQQLTNLAQFTNQRFGKGLGYTFTPKIDSFKGWKVIEISNPDNVFRMLDKHRFDLMLGDAITATNLKKKENLKIRMLHPLADSVPMYFGFNPQYAYVIPLLDATLQQLIDEGEVDRAYKELIGIERSEIKSWKVVSLK